MRRFMVHALLGVWIFCWCIPVVIAADSSAVSLSGRSEADQVWTRLLSEAEQLHLPTKFLKAIPPEFVQFEFDDLRTYAAEYHPGEHRMVLNRSLSFNAAARTLRPLGTMAHRELALLYHELFHAYMDYIKEREGQPIETGSTELMQFARQQIVCRYGQVKIAPVVQRMGEIEVRYLTPSESWEALNEAWAVFVGWAVWNQLELQGKSRASIFQGAPRGEQWLQRLKTAFLNGELRGYYAPEDQAERLVAQKRHLAEQLAAEEVLEIMKQAFGLSNDFVDRTRHHLEFLEKLPCPHSS